MTGNGIDVMQMHVVTLFPEMVRSVVQFGVVGRAVEREIVALHCEDPRENTRGIITVRSMIDLMVVAPEW